MPLPLLTDLSAIASATEDHCSLGTSSVFTESQRLVRRSLGEGGNACSIDTMMNGGECEACQLIK